MNNLAINATAALIRVVSVCLVIAVSATSLVGSYYFYRTKIQPDITRQDIELEAYRAALLKNVEDGKYFIGSDDGYLGRQ